MPSPLTEQQHAAVQTTKGPVCIVGGAGTGKTHTLIARVAHLIQIEQVVPSTILVLTFTNKAAYQLNEYLSLNGLPQVHATTFYGLAAGFLRQHFRQDFKILSATEQEDLLRELLYSHERDELAEVVMDFNNVRQAAACGAPWPPLLSSIKLDRIGELFQMFRKVLDEKNAIDFTGLLTTLLELWKAEPLTLATCQQRTCTVMVDDYQDANSIQIELVRQLTSQHNNLCVLGDPDQTIFSWRGARLDSMDNFMELYPQATSITLTKNHRNSATILAGAESLISHNEERAEKILEPTLPGESPIHLWESRDEWQMNEMMFYLLEQFFRSHHHSENAPRSFGDVALLYRTPAEGRLLAAYLAQQNYPFQVSTLPQFWDNKEIRRFLEKLTAVRGIGKFPLDAKGGTFSEWFRVKLEEFIWHQSIPEKKTLPLMQLLPHAMSFDHFEIPEALSHFLDASDTAEDADNLVLEDRINLLTLHASKGLEFPIVMIFGLEEGLLPHKRTKNDPFWVEEERRLLYVGMTRAKEQLHLFRTCAIDSEPREASRFIVEIGTTHLTYGHLPDKRVTLNLKKEVKKAQMTMF